VVNQKLVEFGEKHLSFLVDAYFSLFKDLDKDLKKAAIPLTVYEYTAYAVTLAIFIALPIAIVLTLLLFVIGLVFKIKILLFPPILIIAGLILFLFVYHLVLLFFTMYPSLVASSRQSSIEKNLPFATLYMATIASTGAPPIAIFRFLARMKDFGAIQQDAKDIVEMVDVLGVDLRRALELKAKNSPSKKWAELLIGIKTIIESGGDLSEYLYRMADLASRDLKRKVNEFGELIMMIVEMYLTLVIIGGIFMIILSLIMGGMGGGGGETIKILHTVMLLGVIPMVSVGMAFMIKNMLPI